MDTAVTELSGVDTADGADIDLGGEHATLQAQLAATYQAALKRAGGDRSAVDRDGRDALAALVEDIAPLLRSILLEKLRRRFGGAIPEGLVEDCYGEMVAAVIDAAARFDPDRCAVFYSWVTGKQGDARTALYAAINAATGRDGFDARAQRALSIAAQAEEQLRTDLGRAPTTVELQEAMTAHNYAYQFERLSPEQQALPEAEWRKIVHAKLVNNGMRRAIDEIAVLRARAARPASPDDFATGWEFIDSFQEPTQSASSRVEAAEAGRELSDLLAVAVAGLAPKHKQIVAARLVGKDGDDSSLAAVAARHRVTVAEVKDLVAAATARMNAAHAHYAFLAPGLSSQFEDAPAQPAASGGVAGLLHRLQAAAL